MTPHATVEAIEITRSREFSCCLGPTSATTQMTCFVTCVFQPNVSSLRLKQPFLIVAILFLMVTFCQVCKKI